MRRIIVITVVIIGIPFFVVNSLMIEEKELGEINLNYLSSQIVRVKRENGVIDNVLLEDYVIGVVAGEMPASFDMEALKAQSVASRTYVLKKIIDNVDMEYDVVDTVSNQVYLDDDELKEKWGINYTKYINKIRMAVNETSMEYLEYDGKVISAMYFSTSNGYTEDSGVIFQSSLPYLKSVESSWDKEVASAFYSSISISLQEFYDKLDMEYNKNLVVEILEKSDSNRVIKLKINGKSFTGKELYSKLRLRSYDFELVQLGSNVLINTKGYGHGVGMSQYGAYGMAKEGYNYKEILEHYYGGTKLVKWT